MADRRGEPVLGELVHDDDEPVVGHRAADGPQEIVTEDELQHVRSEAAQLGGPTVLDRAVTELRELASPAMVGPAVNAVSGSDFSCAGHSDQRRR